MIERTLTQALKDLPRLLDAAASGEDVVIVRRGQRFRLALMLDEPIHTESKPRVVVDPEVLEGNWTWATGENGQLELRAKRETS